VVAVREAEVTGEAEAARTLHTQYRGTLEAEAEGSYDPDFGQTVDATTRQAEAEAERRITEAARQAAAQQADEAERLVDPELQAEADRDARAGFARNAEAELLAQAQAAEFAGDLVLAASLLEQANRSSAAAVLESWWQAGRGARVIAAGGKDRVWEVRDPADWAMVWSARDMEPANGSRTVHAADRLRRGLGWADGVVLALSHLWFGDDVPKLGRVAGVLARPQGSRGSGPRSWADRWAEVPCDAYTAATTAIRLLSTAW